MLLLWILLAMIIIFFLNVGYRNKYSVVKINNPIILTLFAVCMSINWKQILYASYISLVSQLAFHKGYVF